MTAGSITDQQISASSYYGTHRPNLSRFNGESAWCVSAEKGRGAYLEVDLGLVKRLTWLGTQGHGKGYVNNYTIQYKRRKENKYWRPLVERLPQNISKIIVSPAQKIISLYCPNTVFLQYIQRHAERFPHSPPSSFFRTFFYRFNALDKHIEIEMNTDIVRTGITTCPEYSYRFPELKQIRNISPHRWLSVQCLSSFTVYSCIPNNRKCLFEIPWESIWVCLSAFWFYK